MKMEKPTVKAVRFTSSDVIATSGGGGGGLPSSITLYNFGDENPSNNYFKMNVTTYGPGGSGKNLDTFMATMGRGNDAHAIEFADNDYNTHSLNDLWDNSGYEDDPMYGTFNGTYTWYHNGTVARWWKNHP